MVGSPRRPLLVNPPPDDTWLTATAASRAALAVTGPATGTAVVVAQEEPSVLSVVARCNVIASRKPSPPCACTSVSSGRRHRRRRVLTGVRVAPIRKLQVPPLDVPVMVGHWQPVLARKTKAKAGPSRMVVVNSSASTTPRPPPPPPPTVAATPIPDIMGTIARRRGKRLCAAASRRPRPSWPRLVPPPQSPPTVALVAGFSTQTIRQRPAATNRVVKGHRRCGGPEGRSAPPRVAAQRDWKEVRHAARTRTVGVAHARASVARCIRNREGAARKEGSHTIRCWMVLRHGSAAASTRGQTGDNRRGETLQGQAPLVRTRRRACQGRDLQRGHPGGCRPSTHQTQPFLSVC